MTVPETIGFWITTGAAVLTLVYAAATYHWPKAPRMSNARSVRPAWRSPVIPLALAIVAWAAAGFSYYDSHYNEASPPPFGVHELAPEDARLEVWQWQLAVKNQEKSFYVNIHVANKGPRVATGLLHAGTIAVSNGPIADSAISSILLTLRIQLYALQDTNTSEIQPSDTSIWFSVPDVKEINSSLYDAWQSGKLIYVFNMIRYKDGVIQSDKSIYTESCVYYVSTVQHLCEGGHNRIYISD